MAKTLKPGDRVSWNTSQGETSGKVVRKITAKTKIKGHTAKPSPSNPEYLVQSDRGGKAAHKPSALKKA